MSLTPDQEHQIRTRRAAATDGPWKNTWEEEDNWHIITGPPTEIDGDWLDRPVIATVNGQDPANAEFITNALADCAALHAELDQVREVLDHFQKAYRHVRQFVEPHQQATGDHIAAGGFPDHPQGDMTPPLPARGLFQRQDTTWTHGRR